MITMLRLMGEMLRDREIKHCLRVCSRIIEDIPKVGKKYNRIAKSYRMINMISFLMIVLESNMNRKVIDKDPTCVEPWGTPASIFWRIGTCSSTTTFIIRTERKLEVYTLGVSPLDSFRRAPYHKPF